MTLTNALMPDLQTELGEPLGFWRDQGLVFAPFALWDDQDVLDFEMILDNLFDCLDLYLEGYDTHV